ncbi:calpain-7-like [Anoplophora glabripennis]|uniref:calpain-7-like n=1 Tax=Anoplophora glabripennis TaxID=217634 RepID=UPI0008739A55|nr:calpain-7-like [Anoplophora glabripennis]
MSNPGQLLDNAVEAAKKAVQYDEQGEPKISAYYYEAAARLLEQAAITVGPERGDSFREKAHEYKNRASELMNKSPVESKIVENDTSNTKLKQCYFLLQQAIDEDEQGDKEDAVELYTKAIEYITQFPDLMQGDLKTLTLQALDRAEQLKGIRKEPTPTSSTPVSNPSTPTSPSTPPNIIQQKPTTNVSQKPKELHRGSSAHLKVSGQDTYTEEEKLVLLHTSKINRRDYVPFMNVDLSERFQYSIPFTDKDGPLTLSPKQKRDFHKFARPEELCSDPCIVYGTAPSYLSIKQTVISDCSFVASLAVSASYEKRFGRKLVTAIIYPQSKDRKPIYNPFGKYMIKLHINGVARKVIIDDTLPIDRYGRLLCSYSGNKNEFWISLLEKAYMKVMGGYDFPGSNSNIDLHALTGWIPERIAIRVKESDFNRDSLFNTLETRLAKGDVLVTVATGELSENDAERSGLVPTHAYAVMDVQTVKGVRLLKLKNPWSHLRWRGNYSELDTRHWTPELQNLLNYDPNSAAQFDNGVFWIDYDSVLSFFDVFYMNWNPELFKYTYCIHQSWHAGRGPAKDLYTVASNPQYSLDVGSNTSGAVWLLLTRHITDIDDFRENKEYITLYVYKNGKKVYYPYDPPPFIDGVKINSPHYLCKIILGPGSSRRYTVVVSQYEKSTTIYYTLRAYATCPFTLTKIVDPYTKEKQITGEWKGTTAGGCPNHPSTYPNNPKFKVDIESSSNNNQLLIELKGPKQYQLGVEATILQVNDETVTAPFRSKSSGTYRSGYVVLELENIPSGTLRLIPSTFLPNQEGPFILVVKSSAPIEISSI